MIKSKLGRTALCGILGVAAAAAMATPPLRWAQRYDGTSHFDDYGGPVRTDNAGNIYVGGISYDAVNGYDMLVTKYSASGEELWVRRYDGPNHSDDQVWQGTIDTNGNFVVCGWSDGGSTGYDAVVLKYAPDGTLMWVHRYDEANDSDYAFGVGVDGAGNAYITGISYGSGSGSDFYCVKIHATTGAQVWERRFSTTGFDEGYTMNVDLAGNCYVAGDTQGADGWEDYLLVKYDTNGVQQYMTTYNHAPNSRDFPYMATIDGSGNFYVVGVVRDIAKADYDICTLKVGPTGNVLWARQYDGSGQGFDYGWAIAVDQLGNVYSGGDSDGHIGDTDGVILKYDSSGNNIWTKRITSTSWLFDDGVSALRTDAQNNLYMVGSYWLSPGRGPDLILQKYDPAGNLSWEQLYNSPHGGAEFGYDMWVDANGAIVAAGMSSGPNEADQLVVKYSDSLNVVPSSMQVTRGVLQSGGLAELMSSDNQYVNIFQAAPFTLTLPNAELEVTGNAGITAASSLTFRLESSCSGLPSSKVMLRIELFNYTTNKFDIVYEGQPSTTDAVQTVTVTSNAWKYVGPLKTVRARSGWYDRGVVTANWGSKIDLTGWEIAP